MIGMASWAPRIPDSGSDDPLTTDHDPLSGEADPRNVRGADRPAIPLGA
jgi:hypothetical protein